MPSTLAEFFPAVMAQPNGSMPTSRSRRKAMPLLCSSVRCPALRCMLIRSMPISLDAKKVAVRCGASSSGNASRKAHGPARQGERRWGIDPSLEPFAGNGASLNGGSADISGRRAEECVDVRAYRRQRTGKLDPASFYPFFASEVAAMGEGADRGERRLNACFS